MIDSTNPATHQNPKAYKFIPRPYNNVLRNPVITKQAGFQYNNMVLKIPGKLLCSMEKKIPVR